MSKIITIRFPSQCDITYNIRNKPTTISQNGITVTLDYDASGMRRHTQITNGQAVVKQKDRVSSLYEKETGIVDRHIDYIIADGQVVAVHIKEGSTENLYYVLTDHLGSWNKVMVYTRVSPNSPYIPPAPYKYYSPTLYRLIPLLKL